jgi:uncharacterized protein (UPF0261 family)
MQKTILMIGAFDTKADDFEFLRTQLLNAQMGVVAMNIGTMGSTDRFAVDIEAEKVATAAGTSLSSLRDTGDRGEAMKAMAAGAPRVVREIYDAGDIDGVIGMGGTGGSSVICAAMRALPLGFPKVCVSTAASGDVSPFVGTNDIIMFPSVVDVAGINRISRRVYANAAGAIAGMVAANHIESAEDRPVIAASMFGNTTTCVESCAGLLDEKGFETLIFHAIGSGGRTMESLVDEGLVDGVLDITTTEWADEICGGVFSAGPDRLSAPGRNGVPHLIVPGCVDMANFGPLESVPEKFRDGSRTLYEWNLSVTLMRTNAEENREMGRVFAEKANAATGPVGVLLPLNGVSILDGDGERFCDRAADRAMFEALKEGLRDNIPVIEVEYNINDAAFSATAVDLMLELLNKK